MFVFIIYYKHFLILLKTILYIFLSTLKTFFSFWQEMGGYFIINGLEKVIRMLIMPRRNFPLAMTRHKWKNRGPGFTEYGKLKGFLPLPSRNCLWTKRNDQLELIFCCCCCMMFIFSGKFYYIGNQGVVNTIAMQVWGKCLPSRWFLSCLCWGRWHSRLCSTWSCCSTKGVIETLHAAEVGVN